MCAKAQRHKTGHALCEEGGKLAGYRLAPDYDRELGDPVEMGGEYATHETTVEGGLTLDHMRRGQLEALLQKFLVGFGRMRQVELQMPERGGPELGHGEDDGAPVPADVSETNVRDGPATSVEDPHEDLDWQAMYGCE
ncbi:hypothetical protein TRAPUB_7540 [Trametes pubescens]|uniref:Uncharacterized protein n=1 Tax=Trametes pubescens TaxID=154538 RepID=A0A1M2V3D4_TRAPU|nr:hypothetical protein TRAPUB_7540 [Trametes pubescens]